MKVIFTCLFIFLLSSVGIAQCGNGNTLVPGSLTPPGVGLSTSLQFNSGQYVLAYVQGGANYEVSTCSGSTGGGPTYDTQLTVYEDATGAYIGYNDDYCGLQSTVNFTPSFCGYVRILLHQYSCNASNLPWIVTMTQNTAGSIQTYTLPAVSSQTNISCFGASDGIASVQVSGTTGAVRYSWAPSGGTSATATGLSAGVYTVTVSDAVCEGTLQTFTITAPPALTATASHTDITCFGASDGLAGVVVSGGTTPYSYTWSPSGGAASTASGLSAGNYTNTIADARGCTTTASATILEPTALAISAASASLSCFGGSNGSATVTVSGGTGPYTYDWLPGAPSGDGTPVVTGLTAGTWTCNATDSRSCTITTTISIAAPAALSSLTTATNVSCFGASTGVANVSVSGGTSGYTYTWSPSGGSAATATGLAAGNYSVAIADANGCTTTNTVNISQPASGLTTTISATNVLCFGNATGSATVTASGGGGSYTYLWSTAATTSVITGQTAGVKTVTVTDANSCTSTSTINITQPAAALSTSTAVANVLCFGNATGSATVTASGGTGSYTYLWSTAATTSVITGQPAGVKTVTVTDANSCTTTNTLTIIQPASALGTSTAVANVLCFGNATGSATVTASGGTGSYTYLWSTAATTSVITGQTAGVKTVTVTDANGCTRSNTVTITQPASGLATTISATNVLCFGNATGSATVTASGGSGSYTYLWSTTATTSVITGATSGVKTVTVTDANSCTSTSTINITQPASALGTSTAVANVLCFGNATGSATVTASGGTGSYTYLWSTAATTSVITGQPAGVKTVTVTDANSCTTTNTLTIIQPASALGTSTAVANVLCFGNATGSATVTASGGTGSYTYLWSTAATTSVITGQTAGVKTVTVTDANGCTRSNTVTITQPASGLTTTISATNVLCFGNATGSATVTASGGGGSYTYLWSTAATTSVITGQTAGVKTVTVTDVNNCVSQSSVTISQPASALSATQTQTNITCAINGRAAVSAAGGTIPYTYTWSPSGGNAATSSTLTAGNYTCVTEDANHCTVSNVFAITANTVAPLVAVIGSTAICQGATVTLVASGANTYSWNTGASTASISAGPSSTTVYTVTGTTTVNSCSTSVTHTLVVNPNPTVTATPGSTLLCTSQSTTLTANGASSYTWSTGSNASSIVISPTVTTGYTLTGTGTGGCTGTTSLTITVVNTPTVTAVSSSSAVCAGASATLSASGASTYSWSTGATTQTIVVNPASSITYTVNGMVGGGCNSNATVGLLVNPNPTVSIAASQSSVCPGQSSTLTASGASTYSWNTGSTASSITSTPVVPLTYTVTGFNAAGCSHTATQTIGLFPSPSINMVNVGSSSASVCAGSSSTLAASGVNTYTWSTGSNNPSIVITPTVPTSYSVAGTDLNGCVASASVQIGVNVTPTVTAIATGAGICVGGSVQLSASGASSYLWSTGESAATITVSPQASAVYSITGTNSVGCTATTTLSVVVFASPSVSAGADVEVASGSSYQFNPSVSGAVSYTWSPATYLNNSTDLNAITSPEENITYVLTVSSANGCTASDTIAVQLLNDLIIANYMSPNGDGQNDTWKVNVPALIKNYSVTIADGYGKVVFSIDGNYNNEFDGKQNGRELPDGVYYYFIKDGNEIKYKGSITLTK